MDDFIEFEIGYEPAPRLASAPCDAALVEGYVTDTKTIASAPEPPAPE